MKTNDQNAPNTNPLVPEERRRQAARLLQNAGNVTVSMLEKEFGVSPMTARRDLSELEKQGRALRTHGGAVLPGFARHEDSFQQRMDQAAEAKERLAVAAIELLEPDETVFVDSSTTAYHVARRLLRAELNLTMLTNLVPVMELFAQNEAPNLDLVGIGGTLRKLTLSFVGPHACKTISAHFADKSVISVKGVTPDGYLTDPDSLEAEVKRGMVEHSGEPMLLLEGTKFERHGLNAVAHVSEFARVLVADGAEESLAKLEAWGVEVRRA